MHDRSVALMPSRAACSPARAALLALAMTASPAALPAQLQLGPLFGDGMVMQRDAPVTVRGRAAAGAGVTVTFGGERHATRTDGSGSWSVVLPARPAGGPHDVHVVSGTEEIVLRDVLVGDVWFASGQSNMEWTVADSKDAANEIAGASDSGIRHFKVPRSWADRPEEALAGGWWEAADPSTVGAFSAVGYFFARELRRHVEVPIGIINSTWGGSRIEPWMSAQALGLDAGGLDALMEEQRRAERALLDSLRTRIGDFPEHDEGLVDGKAYWADPDLDDSSWVDIPVPAVWEEVGYAGMDGIAWYRTSFDLSVEEASAGIRIGLGAIDDSDFSWVNGHEVGRTEQAWNQARVYEASASILRAGRNTVTIRVEDTGGGGGIHGVRDSIFIETAAGRRPLDGTWKFRVGAVTVQTDDQKSGLPTALFNKMVHPVTTYPIKGVLWYQGEANAWPGDAFEYRVLFRNLIEDWRRLWGVPDMPFLFVQLAAYHAPQAEPAASDWAMLRESQSTALELPAVAQALAIDLGDPDDIHPRNKQEVGTRLALAARRVAYGQDVLHSGPVYRNHTIRNGRVLIEFDHVGGGLVVRGGEERIGGFAIAGADGNFVWADAVIEGDRVAVWSGSVADPAAVRYAWADYPERANLYNAEGLPAAPFRTDLDER